jgi:putative transposase
VSDKREAVQFLVSGGLSTQRACALLSLHRSTFRSAAHPRDETQTVTHMQSLAAQNPRYGYRRIDALLNQTEHVNHKRVRRLWRKHRLQVPRVVRKRLRRERPARLQAAYPGHLWAYDFVEDALADGRKLCILTVMDEFTREGLALDVALSTSAERVLDVLRELVASHGAPKHLRSDTGAEFVARAVQLWLTECRLETLYIEPGKPWQNGKEERFNGTVRDECLNLYVFSSLAEAQVRLNAFRQHYNGARPHSRLGYLTPLAFKNAWLDAQANLQDPLIST